MFFSEHSVYALRYCYLSEVLIDLQQTGKKVDVIDRIHKDTGSTRERLYC